MKIPKIGQNGLVQAVALSAVVMLSGCVSNSNSNGSSSASSAKTSAVVANESLRLSEYGVDKTDYARSCKTYLDQSKDECAYRTEREKNICRVKAGLHCAHEYEGNIYYDYIRMLSTKYSDEVTKLASYTDERLAKLKDYNSTAAQLLKLEKEKIQTIIAKGESQDVAHHPDRLKAILGEISALKSRYDSHVAVLTYTYECFERDIMIYEYAKQAFDREHQNSKLTAAEQKLSKSFDKRIADLYTELAALHHLVTDYESDRVLLKNTLEYHES